MNRTNFKSSPSRKVFVVFNTLFLTVVSIVALIPLVHVIMASFLDPAALAVTDGLILWPSKFSLIGYITVFKTTQIWTGYLNSIFYVACSVSLGTLLTLFGAYVTSRKGLFWNK